MEESSNGSDISSFGSDCDDLDRFDLSTSVEVHDADGQGDSLADSEMSNLSEDHVDSDDDYSDLESDDEVRKLYTCFLKYVVEDRYIILFLVT